MAKVQGLRSPRKLVTPKKTKMMILQRYYVLVCIVDVGIVQVNATDTARPESKAKAFFATLRSLVYVRSRRGPHPRNSNRGETALKTVALWQP